MKTSFNGAFCEICDQWGEVLRFYNATVARVSKHSNEHVAESIVLCRKCREDGWQAYLAMKKHSRKKP